MNASQSSKGSEGVPLSHGVSAISGSMFAFVIGDTTLKVLGQTFPTNELVFLRSAVVAIVLAIFAFIFHRKVKIKTVLSWPVVARCFFDCFNILAFTVALVHMQLAELYALVLISPFIMTILAVVFLREQVGYRRWLAIAGGFCGAVLIIKPDFRQLDPWAVFGLLAAITSALRDTVTKKTHAATPTALITLYSAALAAVAALIYGWGESWPAVTRWDTVLILLQSAGYLVGGLLLVYACRHAPLSVVAAFRYTLLIWGGLAGYLVFGELPGLWSLTGAVLIAGCGLYTFHRETVRHRAIASNVVPPN